jgi:hypothetical protein
MRLKSWESPRRQGRNNKGKGGSARARQLRKREQMLRKRLRDDQNQKPFTKGEDKTSPLIFSYLVNSSRARI